jgi:SAM-dependent methyltransferase
MPFFGRATSGRHRSILGKTIIEPFYGVQNSYFREKTMSETIAQGPRINPDELRRAVQAEYETVATNPTRGFHFHTGRPLARLAGYRDEWLAGIPDLAIESFAGTGNPFAVGRLRPGERVVDVGSGSGMDSLIAARMVGPGGEVVGVDMTRAMLDKARSSAAKTQLTNVEFLEGLAEALPIPDAWADVVISNGVLNLVPTKAAALREMARTLKPGGRLQIADILVQRTVPPSAKDRIDLWTG